MPDQPDSPSPLGGDPEVAPGDAPPTGVVVHREGTAGDRDGTHGAGAPDLGGDSPDLAESTEAADGSDAEAARPAEDRPDGGTAAGDLPAGHRTGGDAGSADGTDAEEVEEVEETGETEAAGRRPGQLLRTVGEWVAVIAGALLVALVVKTFLVQAFWIPSPSMRPTLTEGDRVLVNKLADDLDDINRGDVIVFRRPENGGGPHPESDIKDLIKRVVGLPGDVIESRGGAVYVNDQRLDESYLDEGTTTGDLEPTTVPEGHVFVMGDNRGNSHDSRIFGPIPEENIVGRAFARIWPPSNLGGL